MWARREDVRGEEGGDRYLLLGAEFPPGALRHLRFSGPEKSSGRSVQNSPQKQSFFFETLESFGDCLGHFWALRLEGLGDSVGDSSGISGPQGLMAFLGGRDTKLVQKLQCHSTCHSSEPIFGKGMRRSTLQ